MSFAAMVTPEDNPPVIRFEKRAVEDREKTLEINDGHIKYKEELVVYVSARGDNKNEVPYEAGQWVEMLKDRHRKQLISPQFFEYCLDRLERYKKDQEAPVQGFPLRDWTAVPEHLKKMAMELGYQSVEQVSEMTEEAMNNIGMGAREMKKKAVKWLAIDADSEKNKTATQIMNLENELELSKNREQQQAQILSNFQQKLASLEARVAPESDSFGQIDEVSIDNLKSAIEEGVVKEEIPMPVSRAELEAMDRKQLVDEAHNRGIWRASEGWKDETLIERILKSQEA